MKKDIIKEVEIPACECHQGIYKLKVKLNWSCPICGKPRGNIRRVKSYDGSQFIFCDGWINLCGHIDKYSQVRKEAMLNGLNL